MTGKIFAGLLAGALLIQPAFAEGGPKNDPNTRGAAATDSGAADLNASSKESGADHAAESGTGSSSDNSSSASTTHRSKKHKHAKGASSSPKQEASDAQSTSGT